MRLIVGLGNPGRTYRYTRHNVGFLLIDFLAKRWGVKIKRDLCIQASFGKGVVQDTEVILACPLCFMNRAGYSVNLMLRKYNLNPQEDMLVAFDDLDLEFGKIRIKPKGTSGGHRGVESIIKVLGCSDFARLRMGIGRPPPLAKTVSPSKRDKEVIGYVLSNWAPEETELLSEYLERAADCCSAWVICGMKKAMDKFNSMPIRH